MLAVALPARAADWYVNLQGDDSHDGRSRTHAFRTVQKGVNALKPGDTLHIGPGEYREAVRRDGLGSLDAETTIRAELPGTVVLRGDVPLDAATFKKVDGYRFVYAMEYDGVMEGVIEQDTSTQLKIATAMEELELTHGAIYYDAAAKRLYLSSSDGRPPLEHHYTISVKAGSGLLLIEPRRVTLDGIAATGFQNSRLIPSKPTRFTHWGIFLEAARQCIIRNCVAWCNGGGIAFSSDGKGSDGLENGWNVIEKCVAFSNGSKFSEEGGNILGFASNHDEIRDCLAYLGYPNNLRHYGLGIRGPALIKNCIAWGGTYTDIFIKGGAADQYGRTEGCVTLGLCHSKNIKNSIVGNANQYNRQPQSDVIQGIFAPWVNQENAVKEADQAFADPLNLDFRLQATSKYRGKGEGQQDRGAYPYEANIFYVTESGCDENNGLSLQQAWKTLVHALPRLRPGDTLYIEGGVFDLPNTPLKLGSDSAEGITIRGRGDQPVVLRGDLEMVQSRGLTFERLNFTGGTRFSDSAVITFKSCRFSTAGTAIKAVGIQELKITHCEFTGFKEPALGLEEAAGIWLSGNLFDNAKAPAVSISNASAIRYSDYNAYGLPGRVWQIAGRDWDFATLQQHHDTYSRVQVAQFTMENGVPVLKNAAAFTAGGPLGSRIGYYRPFQKRTMSISKAHLHAVTDSTANLEWFTSVPAVLTVAWGETPNTPHKVILNEGTTDVKDCFNTLSLTGLKPGTTIYYRLLEARPIKQQHAQYTLPAKPTDAVSSFVTAETATTPRQLYVAPDGNDSNSGLSRDQAWQTVARAANEARPGDTVIIAGGVYTGTVHVRSSGSEGKPITFKAAPGEQVILDGKGREISVGFSILGKEYIHLEGLYFRMFGGGGWTSALDVRYSKHLRIERCFLNNYGAGVPGTLIRVDHCEDVLIRNCVISSGFQGIYSSHPTNLRIENNVFLSNLICPIVNSGGGAKAVVIRKNIFVDSIPSKVKVHLFEFGGFDQYVLEDNAFYLRLPDEERKPFGFYGNGNGMERVSISAYDQRTGRRNRIIDNPRFAIAEGVEPKNRNGEPITFLGDWIPRKELSFQDLFSRHPELTGQKIGLLPEEFGL